MSVFSVPVTIGVDEEKIAKEIESNVESKVLDKITNEIKSVIYRTNYHGRIDENDHSPLIAIVEREVRKEYPQKMTLEEIEKKLGYKVEVVSSK